MHRARRIDASFARCACRIAYFHLNRNIFFNERHLFPDLQTGRKKSGKSETSYIFYIPGGILQRRGAAGAIPLDKYLAGQAGHGMAENDPSLLKLRWTGNSWVILPKNFQTLNF